MTALFSRAAYRITLGAIPLLAFGVACAEGTGADMLNIDVLTGGGSGGDAGAGGSTAGSGGQTVIPMAGSTTGGGGMATTAGTSAGGMAGVGGAGGAGGGGGKAGAGGMGGAGGKAGAGGMGGAGGMPATGFRYARFVATSEQIAGRKWTSVAELELFTTGDAAIAHTGWTATADSQETDDENVPASNAIDGNMATFWHTAWEPPPDDVNDAALPHELIIDLGSAKPITGFSYLPRQDGDHGRVKDYAFYLSNTSGNWGNAVKTGTFPAATTVQKVTF